MKLILSFVVLNILKIFFQGVQRPFIICIIEMWRYSELNSDSLEFVTDEHNNRAIDEKGGECVYRRGYISAK